MKNNTIFTIEKIQLLVVTALFSINGKRFPNKLAVPTRNWEVYLEYYKEKKGVEDIIIYKSDIEKLQILTSLPTFNFN